jgi:hypothetical protein
MNFVSDDRGLALVTTDDMEHGGQMYLADFKDTRALALSKTQQFLGLSRNRGIRLGGHPLQMIDGIWYITEDRSAMVEDLQISHKELCLRFIR